MKWESQDESENTRLNHQKCRKVRNPRNSERAIIMEGESAQGDAGFKGETRGFADAGVSVARIADAGIIDAGICRCGSRIARMANAGIADAGFASQERQTRE